MKELTLKLYVTNVLEQITGMNLVNDIDVKLSGAKLVVGKDVKMPIIAVPYKDTDIVYAKVASLFDDCFILEDLKVDVIVRGVEGLMYIGDSGRVADLAKAMKVGKTGLAAVPLGSDGYPRAFWSIGADEANVSSVLTKLAKYLDKGATPKPEAEPKPEVSEEVPADDGSKPEKPEKPAKPKKGSKPEPKPEAAPEAEPEAPEAPEAEEVEESGCGVSLLELFRASLHGDESAEAECRRLCREEGIEFDLKPEK